MPLGFNYSFIWFSLEQEGTRWSNFLTSIYLFEMKTFLVFQWSEFSAGALLYFYMLKFMCDSLFVAANMSCQQHKQASQYA